MASVPNGRTKANGKAPRPRLVPTVHHEPVADLEPRAKPTHRPLNWPEGDPPALEALGVDIVREAVRRYQEATAMEAEVRSRVAAAEDDRGGDPRRKSTRREFKKSIRFEHWGNLVGGWSADAEHRLLEAIAAMDPAVDWATAPGREGYPWQPRAVIVDGVSYALRVEEEDRGRFSPHLVVTPAEKITDLDGDPVPPAPAGPALRPDDEDLDWHTPVPDPPSDSEPARRPLAAADLDEDGLQVHQRLAAAAYTLGLILERTAPAEAERDRLYEAGDQDALQRFDASTWSPLRDAMERADRQLYEVLAAAGRSGVVLGGRLYARDCSPPLADCEIYPSQCHIIELADVEGLQSPG
jgi:hypothetical protein